jgi:ribosomal protein S18 acetylase RimI-like enzyme
VHFVENLCGWGCILQELDMLGYEISKSERTLIYILTLGVAQSYRNSGIGIILTSLIKVAVILLQFYHED